MLPAMLPRQHQRLQHMPRPPCTLPWRPTNHHRPNPGSIKHTIQPHHHHPTNNNTPEGGATAAELLSTNKGAAVDTTLSHRPINTMDSGQWNPPPPPPTTHNHPMPPPPHQHCCMGVSRTQQEEVQVSNDGASIPPQDSVDVSFFQCVLKYKYT